MKNILLTVSGDPGGANALFPVIKLLEKERIFEVINLAYNQAIDIYQANSIKYLSLTNVSDNFDNIDHLLSNLKVSLLLTATSINDQDWEKKFIYSARKLRVFSLAVLDFWSNYSARFSDRQNHLIYLPDKIAVMDEAARVEGIRDGIPSDKFFITGQPAFDSLKKYKDEFTDEHKLNLRKKLKINAKDILVTFFSQPIKKTYINNLGYDEEVVLEHLIAALEYVRSEHKNKLTLLIRPHPTEAEIDYRKYSSNSINIIVSKTENGRDLAMCSDLVIGMNTILLVEASYLNCIVLSLQPGLRKSDMLPTNKNGLSIPVYEKDKIRPALVKYLFDQQARSEILRKKRDSLGNASQKIVDFVMEILK